MTTTASRRQLEALAEEIFGLTNLSYRMRARAQRGSVDNLSETEYLALDMLSRNESLTVGQIQKGIGVLPAQMSRIIRSLEDKGGTAYIRCTINSDDRRKIDVSLTTDGAKSLAAFRAARIDSIIDTLAVLSPEERDDFVRILRKIQREFAANLQE